MHPRTNKEKYGKYISFLGFPIFSIKYSGILHTKTLPRKLDYDLRNWTMNPLGPL